MLDVAGRAKWDSWSAVGASTTQAEAKKQYARLVVELSGKELAAGITSSQPRSGGGGMGPTQSVMLAEPLADGDEGFEASELSQFASQGDVAGVRGLMRKGAASGSAVDETDENGQTALHLAVDNEQVEMVCPVPYPRLFFRSFGVHSAMPTTGAGPGR